MLWPALASATGIDNMKAIASYTPGSLSSDEALKVFQNMAKIGTDGYLMDGTVALNHTQSQTDMMMNKALFIPNGNWMEGEMADMTQNEKSKIRAKVIKWVTRLFLILVAIIMLYPLAWNVVSSFKTSTEFLTDPFAWPQGLAWDNYVRAYEKSNLAANIGNSIYVVLETLVIIVVCVVPCSYCLVRYKFPGAKLILNIYMVRRTAISKR